MGVLVFPRSTPGWSGGPRCLAVLGERDLRPVTGGRRRAAASATASSASSHRLEQTGGFTGPVVSAAEVSAPASSPRDAGDAEAVKGVASVTMAASRGRVPGASPHGHYRQISSIN
jgi:hypothetical protein